MHVIIDTLFFKLLKFYDSDFHLADMLDTLGNLKKKYRLMGSSPRDSDFTGLRWDVLGLEV